MSDMLNSPSNINVLHSFLYTVGLYPGSHHCWDFTCIITHTAWSRVWCGASFQAWEPGKNMLCHSHFSV